MRIFGGGWRIHRIVCMRPVLSPCDPHRDAHIRIKVCATPAMNRWNGPAQSNANDGVTPHSPATADENAGRDPPSGEGRNFFDAAPGRALFGPTTRADLKCLVPRYPQGSAVQADCARCDTAGCILWPEARAASGAERLRESISTGSCSSALRVPSQKFVEMFFPTVTRFWKPQRGEIS